VPTAADALWWIFLAAVLAVGVLVGGLAVAMILAQRRMLALHRAHMRGLLAAQEEERAWVAREVHDDAIQRLAALHHELQALERSQDAAARTRQLGGIVAEVEDLSTALRQLAHRLHPAAIEQAGLVAALEQLAGEVSRASGLRVDLEIARDGARLPPTTALGLFRIAQEALRNVVRHAAASRASIRLAITPDTFELRIEDDGRGFDPDAVPAGGLGLVSMRERARLAGGKAEIRPLPDGGTVVSARVPRRAVA
jgi:two-component system sensor histidine kinase UhpB